MQDTQPVTPKSVMLLQGEDSEFLDSQSKMRRARHVLPQ